jgi:DnaJ like chaperone protein
MQWVGKAVGGILGYAIAGPFGSLLGVVLGHQFDQGVGSRFIGSGSAGAPARIRALFFRTTFEVMGHLAKVDGRVSEEEIAVARRIMHGMKLSPEAVRLAIQHFTDGKQSSYPLRERLRELHEEFGGRHDLARAFVEIQVQAAIGAGTIEPAKRQLLWQTAQTLGIGRVELAQIEALVHASANRANAVGTERVSLDSAYRVLGVTQQASDKDVKTAYRRLMNQHHPDKLVSKGLPESMIDVAEEKTQEIRAAYDRIKSERGFK